MSTRHVKEKSARYIAVGHTLHSSKYFLTFNLSTHVNVSTNSKYWISLAFNLNSTLSIPAISVIVTPFFSKLVKPRAVYGISKYSTSRWVGNLENLMKTQNNKLTWTPRLKLVRLNPTGTTMFTKVGKISFVIFTPYFSTIIDGCGSAM